MLKASHRRRAAKGGKGEDAVKQVDEPAPSKLVEAEFTNIWNQVNRDLESAGRSFADEDTTEEDARAEYTRLAERRVRLGLVLAEIGEKAGVQVSDDELQRSLFESVRRFPADQQQQVFDFYRNNPNALANLRAPLFEEKVVDHVLGSVSVTDRKVSKEELSAEDSDETPAKPVKKAASKKAGSLLERVRKGEDFSKVAREESDDSSASEGGMVLAAIQTLPGCASLK